MFNVTKEFFLFVYLFFENLQILVQFGATTDFYFGFQHHCKNVSFQNRYKRSCISTNDESSVCIVCTGCGNRICSPLLHSYVVKGRQILFPHPVLLLVLHSTYFQVFYGGEKVSVNPKINNMHPGYKAADYEYILISDSGIRSK